ncbi:MAG: hypothetical protein FJ368_04620 [Pelagibacterales bacterium]|nr:hypothetical protein [Pelagibacterales bacterium]
MKKNKAHSLIELSVVLIIIGVMIAGVIGVRALVDSSRIANSKSITKASVVPNINGLVAWYETSSSESFLSSQRSDGTQVTSWYDINPISIPSKKNTLVANSGSVTYLKNGIGNLPSLQFSSANDSGFSDFLLSSFDKGKSNSNTIFVVFSQKTRDSTGNTIRNLISNPSSGTNGVVKIGYRDNGSSDSITMEATSLVESSSTNIPTISDNLSIIAAFYYDRAYSKGYVNNASNPSGGGYLSNPGNNSLAGLVLGSSSQNNTRFVGLISEVIIYDRPLKKNERIDVLRYLSKKYNITVSGT